MRVVERERFVAQREQLDRWVNEDAKRLAESPRDASLQFVVEQGRRNQTRLAAAIAGQTPSAVVDGRATSRAELARMEAAHAADNVVTFLDRAGQGDVIRAARWLLRLDLERLDVAPVARRDGLHWALAMLRATPEHVADVRERVKNAVVDLLDGFRG